MKAGTIFPILVGLVLCGLSSASASKKCSNGTDKGSLTDIVGGGNIQVNVILSWVKEHYDDLGLDAPTASLTNIKKGLCQFIINGEYDKAIDLTTILQKAPTDELISEPIQKLLNSNSIDKSNVLSFAYQLFINGNKDVVEKHFPPTFKSILEKDTVKIVNKEYDQALKLDLQTDGDGDRLAWGDSKDKTSKRIGWEFKAEWKDNAVTYKIYNKDCKMYLKLAVAQDGDGDRQAYGSTGSDTNRHRFTLEPHNDGDDLYFYIINIEYNQGLKLVTKADNVGDRALMSHNGNIYANGTNRFKWVVSEV